jgi:hypothetical protein
MSMVEVNSSNVFGRNVCDTCGEQATHAVRNRVEERNSGFTRFAYGPWRFGCDIHKKKRITKYLNGTVELAA